MTKLNEASLDASVHDVLSKYYLERIFMAREFLLSPTLLCYRTVPRQSYRDEDLVFPTESSPISSQEPTKYKKCHKLLAFVNMPFRLFCTDKHTSASSQGKTTQLEEMLLIQLMRMNESFRMMTERQRMASVQKERLSVMEAGIIELEAEMKILGEVMKKLCALVAKYRKQKPEVDDKDEALTEKSASDAIIEELEEIMGKVSVTEKSDEHDLSSDSDSCTLANMNYDGSGDIEIYPRQ